jgi:DNA repair exonuclease SbcCD ATPase subunit
MLVKVPGTSFVRDTDSMGLINTNVTEKNEYLNKVRMMATQKEEINKVKSEIVEIKDDLKELKSMMAQLLSKGSNV